MAATLPRTRLTAALVAVGALAGCVGSATPSFPTDYMASTHGLPAGLALRPYSPDDPVFRLVNATSNPAELDVANSTIPPDWEVKAIHVEILQRGDDDAPVLVMGIQLSSIGAAQELVVSRHGPCAQSWTYLRVLHDGAVLVMVQAYEADGLADVTAIAARIQEGTGAAPACQHNGTP